MSHPNPKQKDSRSRNKQWEKKKRELQASSKHPDAAPSKSSGDVRKWPIVRAYVPIEDVFRATGFGSAGIVRQQPDGKLTYAFCQFSLRDEGIQAMFGKENTSFEEIEKLLVDIGDGIPAFEIGSPELAARYIWGSHALGLLAGYEFGPESKRYLSIVPLMSGSRTWWLQQLTGPQGLAHPGLVQFCRKNPIPDDIPEGKEVLVFTRATFACANTDAVREELMRRDPEFSYEGPDDDGIKLFTWTREYPRNHWSPFSKLGGRQILGNVEVHTDYLVAEAKVLSMASILIGKLKRAFGSDIRLTDTQWLSSDDLIAQADDEDDE